MPVTGLTSFHGPFNPHNPLIGCFPGISTWVFHRNQQINMLTMEPITFFPKRPPSPPQWLQPEIWESSWTPLSLCPYLTFNQIWSPKSESNPLSTAFTCLQLPPLWSVSGLSFQPDNCSLHLQSCPSTIYIGSAVMRDLSKTASHLTSSPVSLRIKSKFPRGLTGLWTPGPFLALKVIAPWIYLILYHLWAFVRKWKWKSLNSVRLFVTP